MRDWIALCSRWMMVRPHELKESFDIYVIHNYLLTERMTYLKNRLSTDCKTSFIELENQAPKLLGKFYRGLNPQSWSAKCEALWSPAPAPRALTRAEIACTASHFYAYQQFLKNSNKEWLLVIEDDALFKAGLERKIQHQINAMPKWADTLFIGGGFPHAQVTRTLGKHKNFLVKHHPATNTTVAYLLKRSLLERMMRCFDHFDLPIDYELAYLLMVNNAVVLHSNPYLVSEGSKSSYQSSIRN